MANLTGSHPFGRGRSVRGLRAPHLFCRSPLSRSFLARSLRYESLEDRRLLAVLTVDFDQDVIDFNDGKTSLREAIFAANTVPGADEIVFDFGHDGPAKILLTQGELQVTDHLTITGSGAELLTIDASGSDPTPNENNGDGSSVFHLIGLSQDRPAYNIILSGMTITGGDSAFSGGGIFSSVTLTLRDAEITNNSGSDGGGVVQRSGVLIVERSSFRDNIASKTSGGAISSSARSTLISDSIFDGNRAQELGGAIYASAGNLQVVGSTIRGNWSEQSGGGIATGFRQASLEMRESSVELNVANLGSGGGLYLLGPSSVIANCVIASNMADNLGGGGVVCLGQVSVSQTTISGNSAALTGGIVVGGVTTLSHSTITNNKGGAGAGISISGRGSALAMNHSIVAGNCDENGIADDIAGNVTSTFSLIGTGAEFLGPLADNGGPTKTHALLPGSPAIDAGDPVFVPNPGGTLEFDQRGEPFTRVFGGRIDIGAFEAQSLIVDTLVDESDGDYSEGDFSLREAIELANRIAGANTIEFAQSLAGGTIALTIGSLNITSAVEIVGLGRDHLKINNAQTQGPIFNIDDRLASSLIVVSIKGLTLSGSTSSAIRSFEDLTVDGMLIRDNSAPIGGGINVTQAGGPVPGAKLTVLNSLFINNRATNNDNGSGGGIAFSANAGALRVANSTFGNNKAGNRGGAVNVQGFRNAVSIVDSSFSENSARQGGGLAISDNDQSLARLERLVIKNNSATRAGGGVYVASKSVEIIDSQITGNKTGVGSISILDGGGGVYKSGGSFLTIRGTTISQNQSEGDGGGIALRGSTLIMSDSSIDANTAKGRGGGIAATSAQRVEIRRTSIAGNSATVHGGGIFMQNSGANSAVFDSTISGNETLGSGGGLYLFGNTIALVNATVSGNSAGKSGGGVYVWPRGGPTSPAIAVKMLWVTVTGNTSDSDDNGAGSGGGIFAPFAPQIDLNHTIVAGNFDNSGLANEINVDPIQVYSLIGVGAELLGPLADNGGPTKTHALLPDSPAINAGNPSFVAGMSGISESDQRGAPFTRVFGGRIDIGAFEAQSLIVDTLVDENDGDYSEGDFSLREAIELANQIAGANTIEFAQSLAGGTILLTMGELRITDSVEVIGLGADQLTIDASGNDPTPDVNNGDGSRVFNAANEDSTLTYMFKGFTITGGDVTGDGGGIWGRDLTLEGMVVKNNAATESGGGVSSINLTLMNSVIDGNLSRGGYGGGGIQAFGRVEIVRSTISNNETNMRIASGGGVHVYSGNLTIIDSFVTGNTTSAGSGGIRVENGTVLISQTVISNNVGNTFGGGIGVRQGRLDISKSEIKNNWNLSGGGVWVADAAATITDSIISENSAEEGGGIYAGRMLTIVGSEISNNSAVGNTVNRIRGVGGGIYSTGMTTLLRSVVKENSALDSGGGIYASRGSTVVDSTTVEGNTTPGSGGGIYSTSLTLRNSTVSQNSAGSGGGLWIRDSIVTQSTISGNIAGVGAGIYAFNSEVKHSTITLNSASGLGGGIFASGARLTLDHSIVAKNSGANPDLTGLLGVTITATRNLIGNNAGSGFPSGSPDSFGNLIGGSPRPIIDPMLGPLADNGGPTKTHALLPGSVAINAGSPSLVLGANGIPEFDQRGAPFARIANGRIDIGAYESQPAAGAFDGDFDGDGDVDGRDFLAWQRGRSVTGPITKANGDATGDGDVDGNDLAVWQATYGKSLSAVGSRLSAIQETIAERQEPELGLPLWSLDSRHFATGAPDVGLFVDEVELELSSVDSAFDNWTPPRRLRFDFGDIATRRAVEREVATVEFEGL